MQASLPRTVALLGYTGLIPFLVPPLAALVGWPVLPSGWAWPEVQQAYGAVILSFLGALHWGVAMSSERLASVQREPTYLWSVVPSLAAWVALLLPSVACAFVLSAFFVLQWVMDRRLQRFAQLPTWFMPLRTQLTAGAVLSLLAMLVVNR